MRTRSVTPCGGGSSGNRDIRASVFWQRGVWCEINVSPGSGATPREALGRRKMPLAWLRRRTMRRLPSRVIVALVELNCSNLEPVKLHRVVAQQLTLLVSRTAGDDLFEGT